MARLAKAVVIGASAGAIQALLQILPKIPTDYAAAILIVVHVPSGRRNELVNLFDARCNLPVYEGEDKQPILPGTIIFAPPDYHMQVERGETISLSTDEPVFFSRPAIDVLFETAADVYDIDLVGVILTGANEDGARGLRSVAQAGGVAIVQDPGTAYARAMPEAAISICASARVLSFDGIVSVILAAGNVQ